MNLLRSARTAGVFLALVPAAIGVGAQPAAKVWRIGSLVDRTPEAGQATSEAFLQGLRQLGYTEGKDVVIEYRWTRGKVETMPQLASDLVRLKVDVIFAAGTVAASAARDATKSIPIVFAAVGDPVGAGLVASLARPGGNLTGLSSANVELVAKRLQLLKEVSGHRVKRVGVLLNPADVSNVLTLRELAGPARSVGITLVPADVRDPLDVDAAWQRMVSQRVDAVFVAGGAMTNNRARQIVDLARQTRLPTIYSGSQFVESGGLMSYAVAFSDQYRRAAGYVDKILKGAKPASLPVEQPTRYELVINLGAAKALGLTIPPSLLAGADRVID